MRRSRKNPAETQMPSDYEAALHLYDQFHALDIKRVAKLPFKMPKFVYLSGHVTWTYYESDKWENVPHAYKHEHGAGVKFCWVSGQDAPDGQKITVPSWLLNVKTLVNLGASLGCEYKDFNGEIIDVETTEPYPDLWATPDGTALIITERQPQRVTALMWGGGLNVIDRGIVG